MNSLGMMLLEKKQHIILKENKTLICYWNLCFQVFVIKFMLKAGSVGLMVKNGCLPGGVNALKDENGDVSGILSSAYDITEQKKDEMELKENELRLSELNATKDKFFSIIAHDLRSPFAGIICLTELLMEKMQNKDFRGTEEFAAMIQQFVTKRHGPDHKSYSMVKVSNRQNGI